MLFRSKAYCNDEFLARTFFQNALLMLHRHALAVNLATKTPIKNNRPYPIEMKRLDKWTVLVNATEDIDRGCLVIPVFYRRGFGCLGPRAFSNDARWKREVTGRVQWKETGVDPHDRDVEVLIHCQPERKLPAGTRLKDSDYDLSMDCHPFWHIHRSLCSCKGNCELVEVAIKSLMLSDMIEVTRVEGNPPNAAITNLDIFVPCIRNTEKIAAGQELVLRWETMLDGSRMVGKRCINALSEQDPSAKKGRM